MTTSREPLPKHGEIFPPGKRVMVVWRDPANWYLGRFEFGRVAGREAALEGRGPRPLPSLSAPGSPKSGRR